MQPPMYQHIIGDKRASLYQAKRRRNGFCSTPGRPETRAVRRLVSRAKPGKRSNLDADAVSVRIDVGFGHAQPQRAHAAEGGQALEDRFRQRFLRL